MSRTRGRRGGWALLELLVVIACATAALALAVGLIFQMLKVGGAERSRMVAASNLERLARDLRADAHASSRVAEVAPGRLVLAQSDDLSVEYAARSRDVVRTVRRGEKADHFEQYRLPEATAARFESIGGAGRPMVAIVLSIDGARAGKADPGYRDYRVEAVLGRGPRPAVGGAR
jgi:type II secretory pathway pseudopilin PulG